MPSQLVITKYNLTETERLEFEAAMTFWSNRLIVILGVTILLAIPLTLTTVVGAFASVRKRNATVIDWIIIFYSTGLVQTCFIAEICTFARVLAWHTDSVNIFVSCFLTHFSSYLGWVILEAGLTVVTVLRYIYIFHPHWGMSISVRPRQTLLYIFSFLVCLALARGIGDYLFENGALFNFCVGASSISYNQIVYNLNSAFSTAYMAIVYLTDFYLTIKIWRYIRSKTRQVGILNAATVSRRQQQNLITAGGSLVCRIITILPYFGIGITQALLQPQDGKINDILYCLIIYVMYYVCVTILLPLSSIVHSPLIRQPVIHVCRKARCVSLETCSPCNTCCIRGSTDTTSLAYLQNEAVPTKTSKVNIRETIEGSSGGVYLGE